MIHKGCIHCELDWGVVYCTKTTLVYIRSDRVKTSTKKPAKKDYADYFAMTVRSLVGSLKGIPVGGFVLMSRHHDTPKITPGFNHLIDLKKWFREKELEENRK